MWDFESADITSIVRALQEVMRTQQAETTFPKFEQAFIGYLSGKDNEEEVLQLLTHELFTVPCCPYSDSRSENPESGEKVSLLSYLSFYGKMEKTLDFLLRKKSRVVDKNK